MKRVLILFALAASAAWGASDELRATFLYPADPSSPPVVSMSQRFVFRGFDRRDGTRLAAWTEDIAARLERRIARPIPFQRFDVIRIEGVDEAREPKGGVFVGQGLASGSLQQRVVVANPHQIEAEALLEGMVQVLLNRYIVASRQAGTDLPSGSLAPDWLSVGVAQGLREDLRRRNREYVVENWRAGTVPAAVTVLGMQTLPAGRAPQKAFCGLLVDWMEESGGGDAAAFWPALLEQLARGEVNGDWLADRIPGVSGDHALNQSWDVWLAEASASRQTLGKLGFAQVAVLKDLLDIRLIDYGLAPVSDLPARFAPGDLIEHKNEDWARAVALRLTAKLREARIGQVPEWVAVADQYVAYFAGFNEGALGSISATRLSKRLDDAERGMTLLEKAVVLQAHYLNNVEQRQGDRPEAGSPPPPVDVQRRRFLDSIEQQLQQGDGP